MDDVELTRRVYRSIGDDLARCGVNLDMAPSADVNTAADNPVIGTRSFGAETALVARHTVAAVHGLQSAGVAACVKHFPGHGATRQDSHLEVPLVDASVELLRERELVPFRAAIEAGTRSIMTAHVRVPAVTGALPATLSPAALTGLLRGEMGYEGVIITDALDMKAVTAAYGLAGGSVLSSPPEPTCSASARSPPRTTSASSWTRSSRPSTTDGSPRPAWRRRPSGSPPCAPGSARPTPVRPSRT